MRRDEFINCCQAVDAGAERYVEHLGFHKTGKVLSCGSDGFEVEVEGDRKRWPSEECVTAVSTSTFRHYKP